VVTLRCEVLSFAYTTRDLASALFDLMSFLLLMLLFWLLESEIHKFRGVCKLRADVTDLVSCAQLQDDIFTDGGRSAVGPWLITPFLTKFGPFLSLRNGMLNYRFLECSSYATDDLKKRGNV